jgi:hypothetical protein
MPAETWATRYSKYSRVFRDDGFVEYVAVPGAHPVEVQRFHRAVGTDPFGQRCRSNALQALGSDPRIGGDERIGQELGGEQHPLVAEQHHRGIVGMIQAGMRSSTVRPPSVRRIRSE